MIYIYIHMIYIYIYTYPNFVYYYILHLYRVYSQYSLSHDFTTTGVANKNMCRSCDTINVCSYSGYCGG